jgi:hypothetical protein
MLQLIASAHNYVLNTLKRYNMPQTSSYIDIPIVDGVNYVITPTDNTIYYLITGTPTLTTNWSISIAPGSTQGMRVYFTYNAIPVLSGNHIFILGAQVPDNLATKNFDATGFYNGFAWTIRFFADSEEVGIISTDDIVDDAITNDKLNNITRGSVKVGGASDAPTDLDAKTSGYILVGDGTDIKSVAVSGDATLASSGAITIVNDAVNNNKLANMVRGTIKVGGVADAPTDLVASGSGKILIGDGTDIKSVSVTGDVTITSAGVTTVDPSILGANLFESGSVGTNSITTINANTLCDATGNYAFACGYSTLAQGDDSFSTGNATKSSGDNSFACGEGSESSGQISFAHGRLTIASGLYSFVSGNLSQATGITSNAFGHNTLASGNYSYAQGHTTVASGIYSHAEGGGTQSTEEASHAEGIHTLASGYASHAQNYHTTSSGMHSSAFGYHTTASGTSSLSTGIYSVAHRHGTISHSSGIFNIAGDSQKIDEMLSVATTNNVADYMQNADSTDGILIPTDCTANVDIRVVAVQTGGTAGTVGDSFSQNAKLCVKNVAGVSSIVKHNGATLANYSVVSDDVLYELSSCDAAFIGTIAISVAANTLQIQVTGENNKEIQWTAYVSMVWTGYRNFVI